LELSPHTQLQLTKTEDTFEILSQPGYRRDQGNLPYTFLRLLAVGGFFRVPWIGWINQLDSLTRKLFILISLFVWVYASKEMYQILVELFVQVRLRLSPREVQLTYEMFGLRLQLAPMNLLDQINRIELCIPYSSEKNFRGYRVTRSPILILWAGDQKYQLNSGEVGFKLSSAEIEWLANELSGWLHLPVEWHGVRDY
jgi:hypothetical protein